MQKGTSRSNKFAKMNTPISLHITLSYYLYYTLIYTYRMCLLNFVCLCIRIHFTTCYTIEQHFASLLSYFAAIINDHLNTHTKDNFIIISYINFRPCLFLFCFPLEILQIAKRYKTRKYYYYYIF